MRVAHSALYDSFLQNMNHSANELQELNKQASSQKKVNKPSDDPIGAARILGYRDSLAAMDQYQSNIDTGKGWLNLADETLMQASDLLTRAKELAEQGATGTLSADQRKMLAKEVNQILDQMVNLGNTRYEGKSIFGGHKTEKSAFQKVQEEVKSNQEGLAEQVSEIEGHLNRGVEVKFQEQETHEFPEGDDLDNNDGIKLDFETAPEHFEVESGGFELQSGGTVVYEQDKDEYFEDMEAFAERLDEVSGVDAHVENESLIVEGADEVSGSFTTLRQYQVLSMDGEELTRERFDESHDDELIFREEVTGTEENVTVHFDQDFNPNDDLDFDQDEPPKLWIMPTRPTVEYMGDDMDREDYDVSVYASGNALTEDNVIPKGNFNQNVNIRIDKKIDNYGNVEGEDEDYSGGDLAEIEYSYSLDGGSTWETNNTTSNHKFLVPGGRVELVDSEDDGEPYDADALDDNLSIGDQITIHPNRAAMDFEISPNDEVQVNNVGKDVFGGIYQKPDGEYVKDPPGSENIFETLGELVGHLETDNEEGIQQSLENIDQAQKHLNNQLADVGARTNRLEAAENVLSGLELNERERLSEIEDVDMAELMTRLASQQMSYEAVLRSSSMIMRMSLVDHL